MSTSEQTGEQVNSAPTQEPPTIAPLPKTPDLSKYSIRKHVWTHFDKSGLVSFPRPVRGRIPNFKGAHEAAAKLAELDVFKSANCIKVNTDKPQETVRIAVLQNGKRLLVPCSRLKEGVLVEVVLSDDKSNGDLKKAVSRWGIFELGKEVDLNTDIKIDVLVIGSVAVSREGYRVGKGEGFTDVEFGMLSHIGVITDKTVIVTTVHDSQVFESLPSTLFHEYDIPVDIIVTPTEVIHVENKLPRPAGVIWNILSQRRLNLITSLKLLREKEIQAEKECHLKEEDTDSETEKTRRRLHQVRKFYKFPRRRNTTATSTGAAGDNSNQDKENSHVVTRFNKRNNRSNKKADIATENGGVRSTDKVRRRRFTRGTPIQFSLRVGNIGSNVRVRDLKNALAERNVKPSDITWRGHRGFAFLHFAKPKKEPDTPVQVDSIVASLQDMKIGGEGEDVTALLVEPAKPITRIETTDITSV